MDLASAFPIIMKFKILAKTFQHAKVVTILVKIAMEIHNITAARVIQILLITDFKIYHQLKNVCV